MSDATLNRFEWAKAVLQQEGLSGTAKNIAAALAMQFANGETGQINPSQETLSDYIKVHRDTIKKALRELRNAGWLLCLGDGGRGKAPKMRLLSPSKMIPFRQHKGGANDPTQAKKRGGDLQPKGGQITPSHYKEEQSLEQREEAIPTIRPEVLKQFDKHHFDGNPFDGLRSVPKTEWAALNDWARWLSDRGLPNLCHMPIRQKDAKKKTICFWLPSKTPPTSPRASEGALHFFETLIEGEVSRYAAQ